MKRTSRLAYWVRGRIEGMRGGDAMGLPQFDEEVIRDLATETSYGRGEENAEYGAVHTLVVESETYRAHVYGTHRYTVRVWDESGAIGSSCTCPYDWGGVCTPGVAVL